MPHGLAAHPNSAMKWLYAVERLALRAVAPRRLVRQGPVVMRTARSARAEWSQRDHSCRARHVCPAERPAEGSRPMRPSCLCQPSRSLSPQRGEGRGEG